MKVQTIYFALSLMLCFALETSGQAQKKATWDYPIKAGSPEWLAISSYEERLALYNIPEEILKKIETKELVKVCLNYPEWRLVNTRNTFQQGYDYLKSVFNGFAELESRRSAGDELLQIYEQTKIDEINNLQTLLEKGGYIFKVTYLELLLSQKSILNNVSNKKSLVSLAIDKYEHKKLLVEHYSIYGLMTPGLILARMLDLQKDQNLQRRKSLDSRLIRFIEDQNLNDFQLLEEVVLFSKDALKRG